MIDISVLMAIHNPKIEYLKEAFDSLQKQIFKNFEVIIIDDCTTNLDLDCFIKKYTFNYKIIKNNYNLGLTKSLNRGFKYCKGKYIARFDDDDIMIENRLSKEYQFLEKNLSYAACFSNIIIINSNSDIITSEDYDVNNKLKNKLLFKGNCLCHSSLMIRRNVLEELNGYDESMIYAQDYDLILRLIKSYEIYKIPDKLIKFRINSNRIDFKKKVMSLLCSYYAIIKYLKENENTKIIFLIRTMIIIIYISKQLFIRDEYENKMKFK